jgi:hypothetical protein
VSSAATSRSAQAEQALPELESVAWRSRADTQTVTREGRVWTFTTVLHVLPWIFAAIALVMLQPLTIPVAVILLIHAWCIPELYAARGANVVRRRPAGDAHAERTALGLLGDLLDHAPRELYARGHLALERGRLGVWLIGESGALLVRSRGRRVNCYCVKASDASTLPAADRVAHLLLALRADESGFATVANLAFSGARWRVRRRLPEDARELLDVAAQLARRGPTAGLS